MCKIIKEIKKLNTTSDHIKIRTRKLKNKYSVYLDFYTQGKREYFYLSKSLYLSGLVKNLNKDLKKIEIIKAIRNQKQNELLQKETGFSLTKTKSLDIIKYWKKDKRAETRTHKAAITHLEKFLKKQKFKHEFKFYNNFYQHLLETVKRNSANLYLTVFGSIINKAINEEILEKNYIAQIQKKKEDSIREFLTEKELGILIQTPTTHTEVKNAFLFSCLTGLRSSDIKKLKFEDIKDNNITIKMQKTKEAVVIPLNPQAQEILEEQKKIHSTYIFHLPIGASSINNHIKEWMKDAKINKNITFHCARHSFATILLTNGIDIYTVSKLLGHTDIKTTMIYAKIVDKLKVNAINTFTIKI